MMTRGEITTLVAKLQVESALASPICRELMLQASTLITELLIEKITRDELDKAKPS